MYYYYILEEHNQPICGYILNDSDKAESWTYYPTKNRPKEYSTTEELSPFKRRKELIQVSLTSFVAKLDEAGYDEPIPDQIDPLIY